MNINESITKNSEYQYLNSTQSINALKTTPANNNVKKFTDNIIFIKDTIITNNKILNLFENIFT
jgi:hypothetical protein